MKRSSLLSAIDLPRIHPVSVRAFHTMRGVVNDGDPYSGFNICHYVGDSASHVEQGREALASDLGIDVGRMVIPRQTHSVNVCEVTGVPCQPDDTDALVTGLRGVVIGVSTADCVPVVMADADAGVIGAAHAGWRGAIGGVVGKLVDAMVALGASPARISAAMGPCICSGCFEVGEEVACRFPDESVIRGKERPHVDLPGYVASQLIDHGVSRDAVAMPPGCTRCRPDLYFSARALGIASGRIFTGIMLPE